MVDEPLIWTSKGNMPVASLEYSHAWDETPEYLKFSETYTLDGEIVKQSAHVYVKQGAQAQPDQGIF